MTFTKLHRIFTHPVAIIVYLMLITISYCYLDKPIAHYFYSHFNSINSVIWVRWSTKLASGALYLGGLLILTLYFKFISHNEKALGASLFLWICVLSSSLVCTIIKITLARARPYQYFMHDTFGFQWFKLQGTFWSFPSGHTTAIMSVMFGLSILYPRHLFKFVFAGILISITRIILLKHFLSDVLAAYMLALIVVELVRRQFLATKRLNSKIKVSIMSA
jgi:membrane-associated phospholipid phosphatase